MLFSFRRLRLVGIIDCMAIDPVRLARIRSRLLAAAVLAVPACGDAAHTINMAHPEPPQKQNDAPINEVVADPPPVTPNPDTTTSVVAPKDVPPPGQTINTAPAPPTVQNVNTPPPAPKKKPKDNVNTPEPMREPDHINTPKPD